jgi:type 1 glutamine amidotransferase
MLLTTGVAAASLSCPWAWSAAADQPRRRLLMMTRSQGFEHSTAKREGEKLSFNEELVTKLGHEHGFDVVCTKDGGLFEGDLSAFDAFLFYTTGDLTQPGGDAAPPMSAKGKERLLEAVLAGKGFLASHCGADTFHSAGPSREEQAKRDPYIAMLGGEFISHGPQQKARQKVVDRTFPGFEQLGADFLIEDEWYSLKNFADDLHVILAQDTHGMDGNDYLRPAYPSTWARRHGKGRAFYTSMGHREDVWTNPAFQTLFLGGLAWAFGNVEHDVPANIKEVTPGAHVMPP